MAVRSSYNGSGVLFDIHASSLILSSVGLYGVVAGTTTRYPLVVQFDNPSDLSSIISITTTGDMDDADGNNVGDIYFSSNISLLGAKLYYSWHYESVG